MKNLSKGIEVSEINLGKINLLVGLSGVGKTQILSSIYNLRRIVKEETSNLYGIQWAVDFSIRMDKGNAGGFTEPDLRRYLWKGSFSEQNGNGQPQIEREELWVDGKSIFHREGKETSFNGMRMPKISSVKSVLSIFSEEDQIKPAFLELMQIHYMSNEGDTRKAASCDWVTSHKDKITSEEDLIEADYPLVNKLALAYESGYNIFQEIRDDYVDIFQQVEDIRFEINREEQMFYLSIKEKSSDWLPQHTISSGMYKTLLYIAEMKLLRSESVVLIDEFENSLGVNCIHVVADIIMKNERDMQFLITSHHPYIINNIDIKNWKVVMREGSSIYVKTAEELNLGKSKHEFFKQLINSKEYTDGIS
jgi:ABC-type dipeptide/oligopeptide/nickel transport system ATPase component